MPHIHKLTDGRETGPPQVDDDLRKHFHMLEGAKSSIEELGPKHTHVVNGELTGPPIKLEDKVMLEVRETKQLGGYITEFKQEERAGVQIGIVEGYIATWDVDRGDFFGVKDQFVRGAFRDSIADHLKRNRQIRFKDHHGRTIGGWPIDSVREDERGLFGIGEINMDVQQGQEAMSLIRQGVLVEFSVSFTPDDFTIDGDLRTITKATIWEGSIVDEPMNPAAVVTGFKTVVPYQDLPLAERDRPWDASAAVGRIRDFTDSEDKPSSRYKQAFTWYDRENANTFGAYKLPIADVINGRLTVVPRAIFAAAAVMQGARGGVDIPESDQSGVIRHLERYYAKMDLDSPFDEDGKQYFKESDVKKMTPRELEKALKTSGAFSKAAVKLLVSQLKLDVPKKLEDNTSTEDFKQFIAAIKNIKL